MKFFERPLTQRRIATLLLFAVLLPALVGGGVFGGARQAGAAQAFTDPAQQAAADAKAEQIRKERGLKSAAEQKEADDKLAARKAKEEAAAANPSNPCWFSDIGCTIKFLIFAAINALYVLVLSIFQLIFSFVLWIVTYNNFLNSPVVTVGWVLVRDVANLFFILILLVIAFSTILGVEKLSYKQHLFKLLLMAVVINFSKMITGLMIDFSQVVMMTFANALTNLGSFSSNVGVGKSSSFSADASFGDFFGLIFSTLLGILFLVFALVVLGVIFVMLLARILMLWILTALSPLPFLLSAFPQGQQYAGKWWGELSKNLVGGPVLVFFLWLALAVQTKINEAFVGTNTPGLSVGPSEMGTSDALVTFAVTMGLLIAGLKFAQESGAAGGSVAGAALTKGKEMAKGGVDLFLARGGIGKTLSLARRGLTTTDGLKAGWKGLKTLGRGATTARGAISKDNLKKGFGALGKLGMSALGRQTAEEKAASLAKLAESNKKWDKRVDAEKDPAKKAKLEEARMQENRAIQQEMKSKKREQQDAALQKWSRFLSPDVIKEATGGWMKRERAKVYPEAAGDLEDKFNMYANRVLLRPGEKTFEGDAAHEADIEGRAKEISASARSAEDLVNRFAEALKAGNTRDVVAIDRLMTLGNNGDDASRVLYKKAQEDPELADKFGLTEKMRNGIHDEGDYQIFRASALERAFGGGEEGKKKALQQMTTTQKQMEEKGMTRAGLFAVSTDEQGNIHDLSEWQGADHIEDKKDEKTGKTIKGKKSQLNDMAKHYRDIGQEDAAKAIEAFVGDDTKLSGLEKGKRLDFTDEAAQWIHGRQMWQANGYRVKRMQAQNVIKAQGAAERVEQYADGSINNGRTYGRMTAMGAELSAGTPAGWGVNIEQPRTDIPDRQLSAFGVIHNQTLEAHELTGDQAGLMEGMRRVDWKLFFDQYKANAKITMSVMSRSGDEPAQMTAFLKVAKAQARNYGVSDFNIAGVAIPSMKEAAKAAKVGSGEAMSEIAGNQGPGTGGNAPGGGTP